MSDDELNIFFIETLNKILTDMKENEESLKNETSKELVEIKKDLSKQIKKLSRLLKKIHCIDDLAFESTDTITDIYEYISFYADNIVIRSTENERKEDLQYSNDLEELLDIFTDDDEDEYCDENDYSENN